MAASKETKPRAKTTASANPASALAQVKQPAPAVLPGAPAPAKSGLGKIFVVLVLLALVGGAAFFILPSLSGQANPQPPAGAQATLAPTVDGQADGSAGLQLAAFEQPEPVVEDAVLYAALADNGIADAVVDVQQDKILVAFNLPAGMEEKNAAFFALGLIAPFATDNQRLSVEVLTPTKVRVYSADAAAVNAFLNGQSTEAQLEAAVTVK